jgi:hypothetical protein
MEVVANFNCQPTLEMVEITFGLKQFALGGGLFSLGKSSSDPEMGDERVSYTRIYEEGIANRIVGGRFSIRNFDLLLMIAQLAEFVNSQVPVFLANLEHHPRRLWLDDSKSVAVNWE